MSSGINLDDCVKNLYDDMKVNKKGDSANERIRIAVFKINEERTKIIVEKTFRQKDLEGVPDVYKLVQDQMISKECCYMLYDCHFDTCEACNKEELVFVMWAPDDSKISLKMQYASSKEALTKIFTGIKHNLQMNDMEDKDKTRFAESITKGAAVVTLEGISLCGGQQQQQQQMHMH